MGRSVCLGPKGVLDYMTGILLSSGGNRMATLGVKLDNMSDANLLILDFLVAVTNHVDSVKYGSKRKENTN